VVFSNLLRTMVAKTALTPSACCILKEYSKFLYSIFYARCHSGYIHRIVYMIVNSCRYIKAKSSNCGKALRVFATTSLWKLSEGSRLITEPDSKKAKELGNPHPRILTHALACPTDICLSSV
jgi:hypothetical protein